MFVRQLPQSKNYFRNFAAKIEHITEANEKEEESQLPTEPSVHSI